MTPHAHPFVHHILAYLCSSPLPMESVGVSAPCRMLGVSVSECRDLGALVGAWAVGGEVSEQMSVGHLKDSVYRILFILRASLFPSEAQDSNIS